MNAQQTIARLIRATIRRAIGESIAGVLVILGFVYLVQRTEEGTAGYYGCLLILMCTPFVLGVIWLNRAGWRRSKRALPLMPDWPME